MKLEQCLSNNKNNKAAFLKANNCQVIKRKGNACTASKTVQAFVPSSKQNSPSKPQKPAK
ncbi:hypothetical protein [Suttonella indologenes]|uniref:hypothetical protein n=1 Tax=Suttonella indologenes TaxID=13276 RepID=UPI0015587B93|nr:hypothetical protein [Suttonella indologenes]